MPRRRKRVVEVAAAFGVVRCFEDDLLTSQLRTFGAHARPELAFLRSVLERGDRVFDLGAHVGSFAIPLARQVGPAGAVVAVEADRDCFDLLCANVAANGLDPTVRPVNAILAPPGWSCAAVHDPANTMATRFVPLVRGQARSDVPLRGIDDLAAEHGVPHAVKIDIEGLELTVLEASDVVRRARPILYAEISATQLGHYARTVPELSDLLLSLGYRLFRNVGERNAAHDRFTAVELGDLAEAGKGLFDVLAVPDDSPRLARLVAR